MASNRFSADRHSPARRLALDGVRIHIAACAAAGKAVVGWAQATDRFAEAVGDELLRRLAGDSASADLVAGVVDATSAHLRDLSALPRAATAHFDARLERAPIDN